MSISWTETLTLSRERYIYINFQAHQKHCMIAMGGKLEANLRVATSAHSRVVVLYLSVSKKTG